MNRTLKVTVKRIIQHLSPRTLTLIQSSRLRLGFRHQFWTRQLRSRERIYNGTGDQLVLSGPFKGMKYLNETVWGPIEPKWIGCYEEELHGIIDKVVDANYRTMIDIGSAEGYYAVGLAMRCPQARVLSFDTDIWSRRQQRRLARLNGVDNVVIGASCGWDDLAQHTSDRTFLLCDIEGGEYNLLDPVTCPALERFDMLVEVHPSGALDSRAVSDVLKSRFDRTHAITEIAISDPRARYVDDLLGGRLSSAEIQNYVNEYRNRDQLWVWMEVLSKHPARTAGAVLFRPPD
jgi:hypothetical protein